MTDLTKKIAVFKWSKEADEAFKELKHRFITDPILKLFDPEDESLVETDSSGYTIGALMLQKGPDGIFRPVAYLRCNQPRRIIQYTIRKCLPRGVASRLKLLASKFTVILDHKNLASNTKTPFLSEQQAR